MSVDLRGVRALVTGAGSGIGKAIARRLASGGCRVAATDVQGERVSEVARMICNEGGDALAIAADVAKQDDVDRMTAEAVSAFGGLDVVVNNAGVGSAAFIESVQDPEIDRVFGVNLVGVIRVTRAATPHLKESGRGRIVNVASVEGIRGSGLLPVYSATKAGVIGMTRANAVELARFGVTVNAVCPGPIQTEMLQPLLADERYHEKLIKGVPMRRLGVPEDVAGAVAFFASEESSFITGNVLVIDGGMTVKAL
ncbi:MAG: SDR family NAD(P)-dependent oxidoreductase [Thermodesulfobacteriota bacterium]